MIWLAKDKLKIRYSPRTREMLQWLGALAVYPEDSGLIPSTYMVTLKCL